MTLTPAYGRDYKNKKDFVINGMNTQGNFNDDGRLVNKEQLPKGSYIQIKYKKNTQVIGIKV